MDPTNAVSLQQLPEKSQWIDDRKDVLSVFAWLATLIACCILFAPFRFEAQ
jgi:hypothetical protein